MEDYVGDIQLFPYNFAPIGYLLCDGRSLPISIYSILYTLIGTTYGGDGSTNFKIPNMLGEEPIPGMNYYICYEGLYPMRP